MAIRDELKVVLTELRDQQPGTLVMSPGLEGDQGGAPPFTIWLAPWAVTAAERLHRQFGAQVDLTVGALSYPPDSQPRRPPPAAAPRPGLLDPRKTAAELDGPAVVRSGRELRHGLLLSNLTDRELQIAATNDQVTGNVVDPQTGAVVGGLTGVGPVPLTVYRIGPGETRRIPLLIGTASLTPRLGYTVPAGNWGFQATLALGASPRDAPRRQTPVLPLTITS